MGEGEDRKNGEKKGGEGGDDGGGEGGEAESAGAGVGLWCVGGGGGAEDELVEEDVLECDDHEEEFEDHEEEEGLSAQTNRMMMMMIDQQKEKTKGEQKLTLAGLLSALDGPTATTGRLLFMTTNHVDAIDPALIRSGRIDYEIEFGPVDAGQVVRLFEQFYSTDFEPTPKASSLVAMGSSGSFEGLGKAGKPRMARRVSSTGSVDMDRRSMSSSSSSVDIGGANGTRAGGGDGGGSQTSKIAELFAERLASAVAASNEPHLLRLSAADVQGHLMKHKSNPMRALETVNDMLSHRRRNSNPKKNGGGSGSLKEKQRRNSRPDTRT
jgi:SpoVK/Ycf46/Vps4 family AAA+-type ATPase